MKNTTVIGRTGTYTVGTLVILIQIKDATTTEFLITPLQGEGIQWVPQSEVRLRNTLVGP